MEIDKRVDIRLKRNSLEYCIQSKLVRIKDLSMTILYCKLEIIKRVDIKNE